jgi:hypothetical protein
MHANTAMKNHFMLLKMNNIFVFHIQYLIYQLEMCKSDPIPMRSDRICSDFGTKIFISDQIGLIKLFRSRIGSDFDIRHKMN